MDKIQISKKYVQELKDAIRRKGMSQADFADMIGFSKGLVSDVLNGKVKPSKRFVRLAGSIFEHSGRSGSGSMDGGVAFVHDAGKMSSLPLLSWKQVANMKGEGSGVDLVSETIPVSEKYNSKGFALRVEDDTMAPEFMEGEVVVVDPDVEPCSGRFVIAKVKDGAATFKQLVMDGGRTYLKPLNDRYPILDVTDGRYQILGVVVQKMKSYL